MSDQTAWSHRYHVFATLASVDAVRALFAEIGPGGQAELKSMGVKLSASGLSPQTHAADSFQATDSIVAALQAIAAANQTPAGVTVYHCDFFSDVLLDTNSTSAAAKIGQAFTWSDALADLGFVRIAKGK